jgi:hypothetical protein
MFGATLAYSTVQALRALARRREGSRRERGATKLRRFTNNEGTWHKHQYTGFKKAPRSLNPSRKEIVVCERCTPGLLV